MSFADPRAQRHEFVRLAARCLDRALRCQRDTPARALHSSFALWYLDKARALSDGIRQLRDSALLQSSCSGFYPSWERMSAERERLDSANALLARSTWSGVAP